MSGDPRVLAGLQQLYRDSTTAEQRISISELWRLFGGPYDHSYMTEAAIRAWTPPASPSLEQRPEPAAPDDPVCARCNHTRSDHHHGSHSVCSWATCSCDEFTPDDFPAPQPAPDLDPVRVEAAAKAAWDSRNFRTPWEKVNGELRTEFINDAAVAITTYLNGGGA